MAITHFFCKILQFFIKDHEYFGESGVQIYGALPVIHFHRIYLKSDHDGISPYADTKVTVGLLQGVLAASRNNQALQRCT